MNRFYSIIIFSLIGVSFGSIRVGMVQYSSCLDTAEYTVEAIEDMLSSFPNIDVIIAPDGALAGSQNKARIIFGRDDDDNIVFSAADTSEYSRDIFLCLTEICSLAATYSITIIPGTVWEVDSSYRVFCTAPIISPDGTVKRLRHKAHQDRCDDAIDSTIHFDTIITSDSSEYTYFLTITNESRDIPILYTSPIEHPDIWLCLESHWFDSVGLAAREFESDTYPDYYIVRRSFDYDLFDNFYANWLAFASPVFISEMSPFSGAFWMQNLADSVLPYDMWYRMDSYEDLSYGIVAECNPYEPSLFTTIKEIQMPKEIKLNVYPNPFNSSCRIIAPPKAIVEIFDLNGKCSGRFDKTPGIWTPKDEITSGIYLLKAKIGKQLITKKIVYLK